MDTNKTVILLCDLYFILLLFPLVYNQDYRIWWLLQRKLYT